MQPETVDKLKWLEANKFARSFTYITDRWAARLGDSFVFGDTLEGCIIALYKQAKEIDAPCKTCHAYTGDLDSMKDGECLNCSTTRITGKVHFNLGLVRSNQELERTASLLIVDN